MKIFRKAVLALLVTALTAGSAFAGGKPDSGGKGGASKFSIALLIPYQGDQSFFDLAVVGIANIKKEMPDINTRIIEIGTDDSKWESYLIDAAEGNYDVILGCTWQIAPAMEVVAALYPQQKFINFDSETPLKASNIYTMSYSSNEMSYLCGVVAAAATTSKMTLANPNALIGFIGGMDVPGINDFMVGYVAGAKAVNPSIKVVVSYVGGFNDVATAKEIALNQYKSGVDVIFAAAGNSGNGVIDAANELNKYVIGVDSDQAMLFAATDRNKAAKIITSGFKTIDKAIPIAVRAAKDGTLVYGSFKKLAFKDNGVGIAKNEFYDAALTPEVKAKVAEQETLLKSGTLKLQTAFEMDAAAINAYRDAVRP